MQTHLPSLNPATQQKSKSDAFTLLELVSVFSLLLLLGLVFTPALAKTRPSSNATRCLNNLRQLTLAWQLYSEDCNGRLVPNSAFQAAGRAGNPSWAGGWLDLTVNSPDNTNVLFLIDPDHAGGSAAFLGPYSRNAALYKCPSDRSANTLGVSIPRVRTVSLNSRVGENSSTWTTSTAYRLYRTSSSLIAPTPAQHFIFTDEREDSINDPAFLTDPDTAWRMIDFPGNYHSCGANFAYADGRAELHRWVDSRTAPPLNPVLPLNVSLLNDPDVLWIQQHAAAHK